MFEAVDINKDGVYDESDQKQFQAHYNEVSSNLLLVCLCSSLIIVSSVCMFVCLSVCLSVSFWFLSLYLFCFVLFFSIASFCSDYFLLPFQLTDKLENFAAEIEDLIEDQNEPKLKDANEQESRDEL